MLRAAMQELPVRAATCERQYEGEAMRVWIWLLSRLAFWSRVRPVLAQCRRAQAWQEVRAEHLKKEPACAACGRMTNLEVHHVIPVSFNPDRQLDPENLITLCNTPCHLMFGHLMSYRCYNKDVRRMAAEFRVAVKKRQCLERFL